MKKYVNATLAALLVLAVSYLVYGYFQLRAELFKVYDVDNKYAYAPEGYDLTIVDFNQFECEHCRSLHPVLSEAVKKDGKVRYLPRIITRGYVWPEQLATAVYAAGEQGKFIELHDAIYRKWPIKNKEDLFLIAEGIGIDVAQLSRDMSRADIVERMRRDEEFFKAWGLYGVPTLLMGKEAIYMPGADIPSVDELLQKFDEVR